MSTTRRSLHADGAASGGLAAAICLAVTQLITWIVSPDTLAQNLLFGLSLSSIAFGGTYAGVFFVRLATGRRPTGEATTTGSQPASG